MIVIGMPDGQLALQMLISIGLPALVGLVTTRLTPGWAKSSLLVILTLSSTVAAELAKALDTGMPFHVLQVLMISAGSYILSMAVHTGIMKPSKLADRLADVGIRADPKLAAIAVVNADVLTEQGPVPKEQLVAELDYAEGAGMHPRDAGWDARAQTPPPVSMTRRGRADLMTPLQEKGLLDGLPEADAPKHRMEK